MTFHSEHRPLEFYARALEEAGFLIEALREPRVTEAGATSDRDQRWQRVPLFLHVRAIRRGASHGALQPARPARAPAPGSAPSP